VGCGKKWNVYKKVIGWNSKTEKSLLDVAIFSSMELFQCASLCDKKNFLKKLRN
jgi:hypothetical protein